MVSIGSKALPARRHRTCGFVEDSLMVKEDALYEQGKGKKGMNRKDRGERHGFDGGNSKKTISGRTNDQSVAGRKFSKHQSTSASQTAHVRYHDFIFSNDSSFEALLMFVPCMSFIVVVHARIIRLDYFL